MELACNYFQRDTITVARELIGKVLIRRVNRKLTSGRIVETEAYLHGNDSACHANKHRTARTEVMFGRGGLAYVYPIHAKFCFNIVTEQEEAGCAVLIRALEPLKGIQTMMVRREQSNIRRLTTGPSCLCQAMNIERDMNGFEIARASNIWVEDDGFSVAESQIGNTVRIGVTSAKQRKLRFVLKENGFVSGPKYLRS